eukprot:80263-Chlamydomonas_euryale.AAC.7
MIILPCRRWKPGRTACAVQQTSDLDSGWLGIDLAGSSMDLAGYGSAEMPWGQKQFWTTVLRRLIYQSCGVKESKSAKEDRLWVGEVGSYHAIVWTQFYFQGRHITAPSPICLTDRTLPLTLYS